MPAFILRYWRPFSHFAFWAGCVAMALGLTWSPTLVTVGHAVMGGGALIFAFGNRWRFRHRVALWLWVALGVWCWLSLALRCPDWSHFAERWRISLLLITLPLCFMGGPLLSSRQLQWIVGAFIASVAVVTVATTIRYALNAEYYDTMLFRAQGIPFVGKRSHIYVSLMLAMAILFSCWLALQLNGWVRGALWAVGALLFVCMHIVGARTGLLAFYAGACMLGLFYAVHTRRWIHLSLGAAGIIGIVLGFYQVSASFRHRLQNTWGDYQYLEQGASLDHSSVALRLVTWRTTLQLMAERPLTGAGSLCDMKAALQEGFARSGYNLNPDKILTEPHNQYLAYGLAGGYPVLVLFLVALAAPVVTLRWQLPWVFWGFWGAVLGALLTESFLQRQLGATVILLFWGLWVCWPQAVAEADTGKEPIAEQ